MNIIFTNLHSDKTLESPKPANNFIPEWYKNENSYINLKKKPLETGDTSGTIKKCIPIFDAITTGYIITSPVDVYVYINSNNEQMFQFPSIGPIGFHAIEQAPNHPAHNAQAYPKWINHWSIKTPKGYSVLVTQPMHRDLPFTIFPGVVDTDKYVVPINFPFTTNDPNFEGLIPKGTPIAQIIPFKREKWKYKIGNKKEEQEAFRSLNLMGHKFFDKYKNMYWNKKEFL
jgi:hypothetical protein